MPMAWPSAILRRGRLEFLVILCMGNAAVRRFEIHATSKKVQANHLARHEKIRIVVPAVSPIRET